jgi:hypothetical protein
MAKTSGGIGEKQNTKAVKMMEAAYPHLTRKISEVEDQIRMNNLETVVVFDKDGNILTRKEGTTDRVSYNVPFSHCITTHNHPLREGELSMGVSFSGLDINGAIKTNMIEIRVVTPTHTYSMKRQKNEWGITSRKFNNWYQEEFPKVYCELQDMARNGIISKEQANILRDDIIMQRASEKFGWSYTKRKTA